MKGFYLMVIHTTYEMGIAANFAGAPSSTAYNYWVCIFIFIVDNKNTTTNLIVLKTTIKLDATGTTAPYSWTSSTPTATNVLSNLFCPSKK